MAKREQKLHRLVKQSKKAKKTGIIYQFGVQVPRSVKEALELDKKNGNTKWQEAMKKEIDQMDEYKTFQDIGRGATPGPDYKRINVHLSLLLSMIFVTRPGWLLEDISLSQVENQITLV